LRACQTFRPLPCLSFFFKAGLIRCGVRPIILIPQIGQPKAFYLLPLTPSADLTTGFQRIDRRWS